MSDDGPARPERPDVLEVQAAGVADELADRDHWLVWQYEWRNERDEWAKVPKDGAGGGYRIDATDPANGVAFDVALETYESGDCDGLGFITDANDLLVGFDWDDCRDPEQPHGSVPDVVDEAIADLDTYTEISPSGTGYRQFAFGARPDGATRADLPCEPVLEDVPHLEMYDGTGGRYLTVTGHHVDGRPEDVEKRPQETKAVHEEYVAEDDAGAGLEEFADDSSEPGEPVDLDDRELVEKAKNAENGDGFERLWNGDTSMNSNDHSRADLALCGYLAFWTGGDAGRMDDLFRDSGLMRDKWDKDRGSQTYGERTIDKALEGRTEFYDPDSASSKAAATDGAGGVESESATMSWGQIQQWYADSDVQTSEARYQAVIKLLEENDFATPRDSGEVLIYHPDAGVFERGGEHEIERELQGGLGRHYSQHEKREIVGHIKARTSVKREEMDAGEFDDPLLCVGNGVINVETRERYDHSPEYLFTSAIPYDHDTDAEAPALEGFMDDITRREADKLAMYEMVGHALHPEYVAKKFMVLFGDGDNGKTVFYKFVRELLGGVTNVSGVELQRIADNRFASETILGSYANIAPDMASKRVSDLGDLKTLTGGEDAYWFEPKGERGFEAVNTATMMFGCNEPPILPERSRAVKTRLVPIELPYSFVDDPDPENPLEKQARPRSELNGEILGDDEEMSGFLNKALDGLERLLESGDVSLPESLDERLELYEQHSDPIKMYAVKCLENSAGARVQKDDVYNTYVEFCRENGTKVADREVFFRKLRQTTIAVSETRGPRPDRKRFLDNLKFTERGLEVGADVVFDDSVGDDRGGPDASVSEPSTRFNPVSIHDAAQDPTGYPTVRGTVATVDYPEGEETPAIKATLVDGPSAIDVVSWDDPDVLEEGEEIVLEHVDVTEFDGSSQLVYREGVTQVHPAPEDGQEQLGGQDDDTTAATDGGECDTEDADDVQDADSSDRGAGGEQGGDEPDESLEGEPLAPHIVQYVRENQRGRDGVPREEVVEHLQSRGAAGTTIGHWIGKCLERGDIGEPATDTYTA